MTEIEQIKLPIYEDERGGFQKLFTQSLPALKDFQIKQANRVTTKEKGVLRGLHYQSGEWAEAKLFRVVNGKIQLMALCIDKGQKDYTICKDFCLTAGDGAVLIPKGYATGYLVLEPDTEVIYFSDNDYRPEAEKGLVWNDPSIYIQWKLLNPIISEKDEKWPKFEIS